MVANIVHEPEPAADASRESAGFEALEQTVDKIENIDKKNLVLYEMIASATAGVILVIAGMVMTLPKKFFFDLKFIIFVALGLWLSTSNRKQGIIDYTETETFAKEPTVCKLAKIIAGAKVDIHAVL